MFYIPFKCPRRAYRYLDNNWYKFRVTVIIVVVIMSSPDVIVSIEFGRSAPQSKNAVCAFQITYKLLSFTSVDYWGNSYDQCSSLTKGSIYHIKVNIMSKQPFAIGVDWPKIGSIWLGLRICPYCVFTLNGRDVNIILKLRVKFILF